jgi:plastin-1
MQQHYMNKLKLLAFVGKEQVTEENMISWCNEKVKASGKNSKVRSFKDPVIKDCMFLTDLMFAIRPNSVNYQLVSLGKTGIEIL